MSQISGPNLYGLSLAELESLCTTAGYSEPQAREVWRWLYKGLATDFGQMTSVPKSLRRHLAVHTSFLVPRVLARLDDPHGEGRKDLLEMDDGARVEVVLLHYRQRRSACISTQVGCACNCLFCATGHMGFVRNLSSAEIVAQVLHVQRELSSSGTALSNFVIMGMGEPLLNYENTLAALGILTDPRGFAFAPRRITLSTVGIIPGIRRLMSERLPINLAVSVHAATDELRSTLVPINKQYPLADLMATVEEYTKATGRRVMFEWVMIRGVNDSPEQARRLVELTKGIPCHVNLIRLNRTDDYQATAPPDSVIDAFAQILDEGSVPHTVRQRRGVDISAGCGQLRARYA